MRLRKGLPPSVTGKVIFPKSASPYMRRFVLGNSFFFLLGIASLFCHSEFPIADTLFSILAFGTASLSFVYLVLGEWSWRNTGFCSACGAKIYSPRLSWPPSWELDTWCDGCGRLVNEDAILLGSTELIAVDAYADVPEPSTRLVGALLMLALVSRADSITFFLEADRFQFRMTQEGQTIDGDDLPLGSRPFMSDVIHTIAGLEGEPGTSLAKEVRMQSQGAVVRARIVAEHFQTPEEKITIEFPDSTAAIAP